MLRSALQSGQPDESAFGAPWMSVGALGGSDASLSVLVCTVEGSFFCCCFSAFFSRVCGRASVFFAGNVLGEAGGVVLGETWAVVDILRGVGGVILGSSWTAEVIKVDAEFKKDEPKPNIFPETDSADFAAVGCVLGPPKPKKPPDACLAGSTGGGIDLAGEVPAFGGCCWGGFPAT